ncbi:MAG: hypothetical protein GTO02_19060, partial [Candidatus Dadabacteria bacterium]|nr:hypothetical protein [Candidatus Dadabacteria bacterium]
SNLKNFNFQSTVSDNEEETLSENKVKQVQDDLLTESTSINDRAAEKLIVLYIMAEKNKFFRGKDIIKATESVGMKFGKMKIFHYLDSGSSTSKHVLFSLLNITEPGYFDLD